MKKYGHLLYEDSLSDDVSEQFDESSEQMHEQEGGAQQQQSRRMSLEPSYYHQSSIGRLQFKSRDNGPSSNKIDDDNYNDLGPIEDLSEEQENKEEEIKQEQSFTKTCYKKMQNLVDQLKGKNNEEQDTSRKSKNWAEMTWREK